MRLAKRLKMSGAALLLLASPPAFAAKWTVVPAQSRIGFTATWLGRAVEGNFRVWSAAIDFDPAVPSAARIDVVIDLASATTGDGTVDGALPGEDWFAVKTGRQARFQASKVTAQGPARYVAQGSLTMRGRAVPVILPFTLTTTGDTATMTGRVVLDRRAWKLGTQSDASAEYVAFTVPLTVRVVARRVR